MDLVLEGIMGPEEANYAYEKYAELTGLKRVDLKFQTV